MKLGINLNHKNQSRATSFLCNALSSIIAIALAAGLMPIIPIGKAYAEEVSAAESTIAEDSVSDRIVSENSFEEFSFSEDSGEKASAPEASTIEDPATNNLAAENESIEHESENSVSNVNPEESASPEETVATYALAENKIPEKSAPEQGPSSANSWRFYNGELISSANGADPEILGSLSDLSDKEDEEAIYNLLSSEYNPNLGLNLFNWFDKFSRGYYTSTDAYKVIDVSEHNGYIDWNKVKASGVNYAIIRCGYGDDERYQDDKQWANNVRGCLNAGMPFGIYIYSYATNTSMATSEANHVLRLLGEQGLNPTKVALPIFLDLEDRSIADSNLASIAQTFCNKITSSGYKAGVYASLNWWNTKLTNPCFNSWTKWVAEWNTSCGLCYGGFSNFRSSQGFWQFSDWGKVNGISGRVDLNYTYFAPPTATTGNTSTPVNTKVDLSKATISPISTQNYTGKAITPTPVVTCNSKRLISGTDFTVSYKNNKNVGTATITITGKGNYTGSKSINFRIEKPSIANTTVSGLGNAFYTGKNITPAPTIKASNGAVLAKNKDYTLSYKNNKSVGTATITIKGKGSYTGTKTVTFKITQAPISQASVTGLKSYECTGKAQTPKITVKLSGKTLKSGTDYAVSYKNNVNIGTAQVVISGRGNYAGTITKTFSITKTSIAKASITKPKASAYTGSALTPLPTVKLKGVALKAGKDFKVTYRNNVNVGTATVTITGIGNYQGTKSTTFKINKAALGKAAVSGISDKKFTGNPITQNPVVTLGGKRLTQGVDYTLSYSRNTKAGKATVTIKGKGNYQGSIKRTFTITK